MLLSVHIRHGECGDSRGQFWGVGYFFHFSPSVSTWILFRGLNYGHQVHMWCYKSPIYWKREKKKQSWVAREVGCSGRNWGRETHDQNTREKNFQLKKGNNAAWEQRLEGKNNVASNRGRHLILTSSLHVPHLASHVPHTRPCMYTCGHIHTYLKNTQRLGRPVAKYSWNQIYKIIYLDKPNKHKTKQPQV